MRGLVDLHEFQVCLPLKRCTLGCRVAIRCDSDGLGNYKQAEVDLDSATVRVGRLSGNGWAKSATAGLGRVLSYVIKPLLIDVGVTIRDFATANRPLQEKKCARICWLGISDKTFENRETCPLGIEFYS